jgi:hypothetical protein
MTGAVTGALSPEEVEEQMREMRRHRLEDE